MESTLLLVLPFYFWKLVENLLLDMYVWMKPLYVGYVVGNLLFDMLAICSSLHYSCVGMLVEIIFKCVHIYIFVKFREIELI